MKNQKRQASKGKKRSFLIWLGVLLAVVVVVIAGVLIFRQPGSTNAQLPNEVSVAHVVDLRSQGAFILDVREQSEWDQFHIPGATLIPLGQLPNRLSEVPKDQKVVVVCRTGHRSAQGRDILKQAGFTQVTSMAGGVTAWQAQGQPVVTGS